MASLTKIAHSKGAGMDDFELFQQEQSKQKELDTSIKLLRKNGYALAEAQREYNVKLASKALNLRSQDMPIGLIQLTIKGDKEVADARFKRDCAQVLYDANKDHVNATKLELRLIESAIQREWGQAKNMV
jgi:hypothetical protein